MFKIEWQLQKCKKKKKSEKVFCFWDNCIWRCSKKLSLLKREYLSLGINGLTNTRNILKVTERDFFQLNSLHTDQWIWSRCRSPDFNSVSTRLPCYLSKSPLKRGFLDIYLTTFFGVGKFKNPSAIRVNFFWKCSKFNLPFKTAEKNQKTFLFLK